MILAWSFFPHEKVWTDSPIELAGIISIVALLITGVTTAYRHWRATECHIEKCHKHQWKEHTEPDGTKWLLCRKHHPLGDQIITHEQVLTGHARSRRSALLGSQNKAPSH